MDKAIIKLLNNLGLNTDQANVYLAALELGQSGMQDLAKKSGVKRTSIYNFIQELIDRQLITTARKKKRTVYSAVHPMQLQEIEKARLAELDRTLPELMAIYNKSATKPKVTFYEGVDGIKEVLTDMLKDKKDVSAFSDYKQMATTLGDYYFDVFPLERTHRGIVSRNIVPDTDKARTLAKTDAKYNRETRFMKVPDLKTEINIYGNKVALNSYASPNPFSVIIEDQNIADTMKVVWKKLWDTLETK